MVIERRTGIAAALCVIGLGLYADAAIRGALQPPYAALTGAAVELGVGLAAIAAGFAVLPHSGLKPVVTLPVPTAVKETEAHGIGAEPRILVIGPTPIFLDAWRAGQSRRRRAGWIAIGVTVLAIFVTILMI